MALPELLSLCLIAHEDALLVGEDSDPGNGEIYYRPLGRHVEPGESPQEAVVRELLEEIGADLCEVEYVTSFDNHFTMDGTSQFERVHVFRAALCVPDRFSGPEVPLLGPGPRRVLWKSLRDFREGQAVLFPLALRTLLGLPSN
jgi:8-oxo-dGTP pyrophosphatase MutT (NUDIX family)